jgi:hypothetical protein
MSTGGRAGGCYVALRPTTSARTLANSSISLLGGADSGINYTSDITSFRIAKSDSVSGSGFKVQMKIISGDAYSIQMFGNVGRSTLKGLELVSPYLDNTPILPDGITPSTFLEAGAEIPLEGSSNRATFPFASVLRLSDDVASMLITMPYILKQGTGLTLTNASTLTQLLWSSGAIDITSAVLSNVTLPDPYTIYCQINLVGGFSGVGTSPLRLATAGTGGKLTITG